RERPEAAPFDAILGSAGGRTVPPARLPRLAPDGRLVIPVGSYLEQDLLRITRSGDQWIQEDMGPVRFVPLIAEEAPHDGNLPGAAAPARTAEAPAMPAVRGRVGLTELVAQATETL